MGLKDIKITHAFFFFFFKNWSFQEIRVDRVLRNKCHDSIGGYLLVTSTPNFVALG